MKRLLSAALALVLALSLTTTVFAEGGTYGQTEAREMLPLINTFRTGSGANYQDPDGNTVKVEGLAPLAYSRAMEEIAMIRAEEISRSFSHTRPDGTLCFTATASDGSQSWGENIYFGLFATKEDAFRAWREDGKPYAGQGHRRNMLGDEYQSIGIGHYVVGNAHYWVQEFTVDPGDWYIGWQKDNTGWWYANADGSYPKNAWQKIDGGWYYFDSSGYMAHDRWAGNYYLLSSGAMATNQWIGGYYVGGDGKWIPGRWVKDGGGWWYRNGDGSYPRSAWKQIDGKWYHFGSGGYMQTGWLRDGGAWYYLNASGAMVTGWQKVSGDWYYFSDSGVMATDWQKIGGTWYYMTSSGTMVTGWRQIGGTWYYFHNSGAMAANCWIGNYYLKDSGAMAVSEWVCNDYYYVGADGKWVPGQSEEPVVPVTGTVYWVASGEVYHTHIDCPSLSRSTNIHSGTLGEAQAAGKDHLCKNCANMG